MLGGLGLVGGLICLLVGVPNHWFAGVHTVGVILIAVDVISWLIALAFFAIIAIIGVFVKHGDHRRRRF